MNENQKFEFVTDMLSNLANSNYIEGLSPADRKISLTNSENIGVEIRQVNNQAEITAKNHQTEVTIAIPVNNLTSLLERLGLLDNKLESKLNFVFKQSTYMKKPEAIKLTIEFMIDSTFPELKNKVSVKIGGDRDEVILMLKNGLDDHDFKNAFPALILRKSFFENCKMFGVKKLVFIDELNKTFDDIVIDNFDMSRLR
jgi:hypothetical protein